ncbi:phosphoglucosamine mutase [Adhaeretor mobilis]|uniref:Phosphomannomutase/phosphoglucomutase n=1 Tax=Adhaeretor mobilis TaxID=1930276 RepID=A0A517MSN6_9BACT|nr:phosphoglucosamine mutase [Adhaeretor mobilis]QDS97896.1 Phosphomannomutase/phosphoglucomutase [Adhaeretor mobilis]
MSKSEPIISVSGLRGIVGESLTPGIVTRYVNAFATSLPKGPVVVTRDGRTTGPMVAELVRGALSAAGCDVLNGGVAATPTTGVLVRSLKAVGGVQISASHNPSEYNGLKLFNAAGRVIPASEGQAVLDRYRDNETACEWQAWEKLGKINSIGDSTSAHVDLINAICNVQKIRSRKFSVLLDANHGAGSVLGQVLLEHLGCEVAVLGGTPDGHFSHPPEPTAENLSTLPQAMMQHSAVIGFCQDPDADRLAVLDETGRYLGEELTLAMCVDHELKRNPGPIVTNCSSSRMSEDLAEKYGVPFFRSKVGEANVVDVMLENNAVLGGEGNGGVIDPRVVLVRDSFVGMALLLDAMAGRDLPISALADELPQYAIHKSKISLPAEQVPAALDNLEKHFKEANPDRMDGLRLDWSNKWLLVRASNTEPIVRAIAEAPTAEEAQELCDVAAETIG